MKLVGSAKWSYIGLSVILIALGGVIIMFPGISATAICVISGAVLLAFGAVKLIGYFSNDLFRLAFQFDLALGLLSIALGIIVITHPSNVVAVAPVIIGVYLTADGVFKLQTAFDSKRFGVKLWWLILILALLTCAAGILLIADPFDGALALMTLLGISFIVDGVQNIFVVLSTVKTNRKKGSKSDKDNAITVEFYEER